MRVVGDGECHRAQEVGSGARLDAQHDGAVLGEVAGGDRSGRARAELEDVDAVPGLAPRREGCGAWEAHALRGLRRGLRARGCGLAVGGPDDDERAREPFDGVERAEEPARLELRRLVDLARRVGGREHHVGLARDVVELLHRVAREVLGDGRRDRGQLAVGRGVLVERGPVPARERVGGDAVGDDELGDGLEARDAGLAATQAERHEPVERGPDLARATDVRAPPSAAVVRLGVVRDGHHVRDEHDFLHRHVDALRDAGPERGERRERGFATGVRVGGGLGAAHGRAVGVAGGEHVPARGHDSEVGRVPRRARAVEPERGDAHPHGVGGARRVELGRAVRAGGVEDDVGAGEDLVERGVVRAERHDLLARVPRTRDVARQGVSPWWDHPHDGGPEVAQHPRRAGRRFGAEVDDAQT